MKATGTGGGRRGMCEFHRTKALKCWRAPSRAPLLMPAVPCPIPTATDISQAKGFSLSPRCDACWAGPGGSQQGRGPVPPCGVGEGGLYVNILFIYPSASQGKVQPKLPAEMLHPAASPGTWQYMAHGGADLDGLFVWPIESSSCVF